MESTRDRLAQHLLKRIVPLFKLGNPEYDPWWWPIGTGERWEDWFPAPLTRAEVERAAECSADRILASLQKGPRNQAPVAVDPKDYAQFHGFWGEANVDGRIIAVVSIRPSRAPYPAKGWACFPRLLHTIGCGEVHVTDIIKRRGPGQGEVLKDFPDGDSSPNYVGMLEDELVALALGLPALHIIPMDPRALGLLKNPHYSVLSTLTEQLGRRPTLSRLRLPFPKDPNCERKIGKWRQAFDYRQAEEKGKGWGFAATGTMKSARKVLGKMPRGFWKEQEPLLRSNLNADAAARQILATLERRIPEAMLPAVLDVLRSDVVWYRADRKFEQRDDDATISKIRKAYAVLK